MATIPQTQGDVRNSRRRGCAGRWSLAAVAGVGMALVGCTRAYYRDYADSDVYGILGERLFDWRWRLPERPVDADPAYRRSQRSQPCADRARRGCGAAVSGLVAGSLRVSRLAGTRNHAA